MLAGLDRDLDHIADRVAAVVRIVHALREENQALRSALDRSAAENKALRDRLETARARVEALIERLPSDA
jgi:cell division protein ZapB